MCRKLTVTQFREIQPRHRRPHPPNKNILKFADMTDADMMDLEENATAKGTKKQTKWGVSMFHRKFYRKLSV
jgi:hypothetical protein